MKIFSPFTDKGKLRLDRVEKLLRSSEKTIEGKRSEIEKNANTAFEKSKTNNMKMQ